MDVINIDEFDSPMELYYAAGKLVEAQLDIIKMMKNVDPDSDMAVFIAPLESLLHCFVVLNDLAETTIQQCRKGSISYDDAHKYFVKLTLPASHIISEHNERQRKLAGKTDI